jgi:hypothetical protein
VEGALLVHVVMQRIARNVLPLVLISVWARLLSASLCQSRIFTPYPLQYRTKLPYLPNLWLRALEIMEQTHIRPSERVAVNR